MEFTFPLHLFIVDALNDESLGHNWRCFKWWKFGPMIAFACLKDLPIIVFILAYAEFVELKQEDNGLTR